MRGLLYQDKRGVSEMVGYVLLIVIAVSIGVLVYGFLKIYVPPQKEKCPSDISLSIEEAICDSGNVKVLLRNRGLFNVDGAFIRIGEANRIARTILNENILFMDYYPDGLPPGEIWPRNPVGNPAIYSYNGEGTKILEIEPVIYKNNEQILCDEAVITQIIYCTTGIESLGIDITSPSGQYRQGENIPLNFALSGSNRQSCWYTLDAGISNVSIPGCVSGLNIGTLNEGSYRVYAFVNNSTGNMASDYSDFSVAAEGMIITINNPQNILYEYSNRLLSFPVQYSVSGSPDSCLGRIFNSSHFQIGQQITDCPSFSRTLNERQINFPRDGNYYFNVSAVKGNQRAYQTSNFQMLVSPGIVINSPPPVNGCNAVFSFTPITRKNTIDYCIAFIYNDTAFTGYNNYDPCVETSEPFSMPFNTGNYRIDMYVNDTGNPVLTGFDSTSFTIGPGCSGNSNSGGWAYPL